MKMIVEPGKPPRLEIEGQTQQELWKQAAFWYSLPTVCPIDGFPVRLGYKKTVDYEFYSLFSTGPIPYEFPVGVGLGDRGMIPGKLLREGGSKEFTQRWIIYDAKADKDIVFWENGRLLLQSPSQQAGNGKQDYTEQVAVTGPDALDAAIDEVLGGADAQSNRLGADATDAQRGTMHSLGIALYGTTEKWNAARPGWCEWASAGEKDSSKALDTTEMKALISELEVKVRGMYDKLADRCNQARVRIDNVNPDQLFGVELAHSYTGALKTYKTSQAQRVAA